MILLVVVASILIAGVTVYQYREQSKDYHSDRLERKEEQVQQSVEYVLKKTTYPVTTENLGLIFNDEIYQIANVQNQRLNIYDLEGQLVKSSRAKFEVDSIANCLSPSILALLEASRTKRYVEQKSLAGDNYKASYTYINDKRFKPIGILNLPYYEDDSFNNMELREFLLRLGGVYFLMLLIAIGLAYFISTYVTRSLQTISDMLDRT
ncbi:two-component sensor histidine kinase, partial [Zobellia sp.]|nr:two-component sensor histidine kinase [Zobellia sp.]